MQSNAATRLADVSREIAAAGATGPGAPAVKANNLGMIGIAVKSAATGLEVEFPVSLELYEDLDPPSLRTYLADAALRMGSSVAPGARYRIFQLPDTY